MSDLKATYEDRHAITGEADIPPVGPLRSDVAPVGPLRSDVGLFAQRHVMENL